MTTATVGQQRRVGSKIAADARQQMAVKPRRILIDCTPTYRNDFGTGVQRVVRNLVNWSQAAGRELGIDCQGVAYDSVRGFHQVRTLDPAGRATFRAGGWQAPAGLLSAQVSGRRLAAAKAALRRSLSATGLLNPLQSVQRKVRHRLSLAQHALATRFNMSSSVLPGRGDVLFVSDTVWLTPELYDGVRQAVDRGAVLVAMIHDLIPLRFAEVYGPVFPKVFREWFDLVASQASFVICNSRSTWEDVQSYLIETGMPAGRQTPLRGGWFRLGSHLDARLSEASVRPELRALFSKAPSTGRSADRLLDNPFLLMGCFDPRKDLATAIQAFERLWAAGAPERLVAIGRGVPGEPSALERMVMAHPQFGQKLFCFSDVEDGELDFCYRRAAALVTASYAEGFNLPIVESLSRGRPVLASDIPVHREVAGERAAYFAPRDADALAQIVLRLKAGQLPGLLEGLDTFQWPNWLESSRELLDQIVTLYAAPTRTPNH